VTPQREGGIVQKWPSYLGFGEKARGPFGIPIVGGPGGLYGKVLKPAGKFVGKQAGEVLYGREKKK
jgi:hypothetical protein